MKMNEIKCKLKAVPFSGQLVGMDSLAYITRKSAVISINEWNSYNNLGISQQRKSCGMF